MSDGTEVPFDPAELESLAQDSEFEVDSFSKNQEPEEVEETEEPDVDEDDEQVEDDDEPGDGEEDDDEDEDEADEEDLVSELRNSLKGLKEEFLSLREELKKKDVESSEVDEKPAEEAIEFVDYDAFDQALRSPEEFNKVLNNVYQAGRQATLQQLPGIVNRVVQKQVADAEVIRDFYQANPDLAAVKPLVSEVAQEVGKEYGPDAKLTVVMREIAKRARGRLESTKAEAKTAGKGKARRRGKNPGAVTGGTGRRGSGRPNTKKGTPTVADEITDMMNIL